jgi:hypothetical protein
VKRLFKDRVETKENRRLKQYQLRAFMLSFLVGGLLRFLLSKNFKILFD